MASVFLNLFPDNETYEKICILYWEMDEHGDFPQTVSDIAKSFGISSNEVSKICKSNCAAESNILECSICETPYTYKTRTDFNNVNHDQNWKCEPCQFDKKANNDSKKISAVAGSLKYSREHSFSLESLSFRECIFLLSTIKCLASEDLKHLIPYTSNNVSLLTPTQKYDLEVLRELHRKNIIAVSPMSILESIEIDESDAEFEFSYFIGHVHWEILLDPTIHNNINIFIEELESKLSSMEWEESWYEEAKVLSKEIAIQESLAYLDYVMTKHQFDFNPGDKTLLVIKKILEKFSVSQLYNLIWASAKDAAAYYIRENIPKKQAANSVVGNIERRYERALANNWDITPFKRNYDLPMSIVSQVLFNTTLQTDDGGFNKPIYKII